MLLIDTSARTNQTMRSLERLMKTLAPTGLPVTMVVISNRLILARDPGALVGVAGYRVAHATATGG